MPPRVALGGIFVYITLYEKHHRKRLELDCSVGHHPLAVVCLMRLYLDDLRPTPRHVWCNASLSYLTYTHSPKTAAEAIALLQMGTVEFISFDHDLGDATCGTGYDVAKWIEEQVYTNPTFVMPDWTVHSGNPVGAGNIQRAMLNAARAQADRSFN